MDKPRYKLLKDMPTVKAGTTFREITRKIDGSKILKEYKSDNKVSILVSEINDFDKWFEEIKEPIDSIYWKPRYNDEYFYISDYGDIYSGIWRGLPIDNERLALGFIYPTEEECKKAKERKLAKVRLQRTSKFKPDFENSSGGWAVCCYRANKELYCVRIYGCDSGEPVHYKTLEDAQKSIKENREDWLIYFGIEEEERRK